MAHRLPILLPHPAREMEKDYRVGPHRELTESKWRWNFK
jgi:hypothetical protein